MRKLKKIEDLENLRKELMTRRDPDQPVITICAGTGCGAYGADDLVGAFKEVLAERDDSIMAAVEALESGHVVAVKGLGGFHLFVDASRSHTVRNLRERKRRSEKPFAVMVPSLEAAIRIGGIDSKEETLLRSAVAPIVIVRRAPGSTRQEY